MFIYIDLFTSMIERRKIIQMKIYIKYLKIYSLN